MVFEFNKYFKVEFFDDFRVVKSVSSPKYLALYYKKWFALHLPLPLDYGRPRVVNFERSGICTTSLEISPK